MTDNEYLDYLDGISDEHQRRLIISLNRLEQNIARYASQAPTKDGKLFDLAWAINARAEIQQQVQSELLSEFQDIIGEYAQVSNELAGMLSQYGGFTNLPSETIAQLQTLSFQGFEEIASTYSQTMSDEIYQYTLTGRTPEEMTQRLRGTINGVYQQADKDEIDELVEIANFGSEEAKIEAINRLHTVYGADKLGNNLRRYSNVYIRDSIQQFNAQATMAMANEVGAENFKYYGNSMKDTREFCRKHSGKTYTKEEIYEIWEAEDWKGKSAGDPFIVRGGYNCRHQFRPII
jgi:hypothetical protein